jgi:hypothetical protein
MPTKRRRSVHRPVPQISPVVLSIVSEGLFPMPPNSEREIAEWDFFTSDEEQETILPQLREPILDEWIRRQPGTRPNFWWLQDAPEKCRRRLGGVGDPEHEHLNTVERYRHGLPTGFVTKWLEDYYNGRARDIHGKRIGTEYAEGHFAGRGLDPDDPPVYESEAAYLRRHRLLTPDEERRLKPRDFEPVTVDEGEECG